MHDHIELISFKCFPWWTLKRVAKFFVSVLNLVMSALFQSLISLLLGFLILKKSLLSVNTASWSLTPGITWDFWWRSKLLVKTRSKIFLPLVGLSTVCDKPSSQIKSKKIWLIDREKLWPVVENNSNQCQGD